MKSPSRLVKSRITEVKNLYFIGLQDELFKDYYALQKEKDDEILKVLIENIISISMAASLPFQIAMATSLSRAKMNITIQNAIVEEDMAEELLRKKIEKEYSEAIETQETADEIFKDLAIQLLDNMKTRLPAIHEIINQGYLQIWSTFEVFLRDYIESFLNSKPEKCAAVIQSDTLKKRYDLRRIPYEYIESNMYDIKNKIGSLIVNTYDCSDLLVVKEIIKKMVNTIENSDFIDDNELWIFFQTRHLLIHKRGIVDSSFIRKTGSGNAVGSKIIISPKQFYKAIELSIKTAISLVRILTQKTE